MLKIIIRIAYVLLMSVPTILPCSGYAAQQPTYELYSWNEPNGVWKFSLLNASLNRRRTPAEVLNPNVTESGVDSLEKRLASMEKGTTVIWRRAIGQSGHVVKGAEIFAFPNEQTQNDLRAYCKRIGVVLYIDAGG